MLENDQNISILGTIVQIFDPRFYEVCPECGKRMKQRDTAWECPVHLIRPPNYSYVFNVFLDDGTDNIRVVLFSRQAERISGKSSEEMLAFRENPMDFEDVKTELLGNIVKIVGKVNRNAFFDRLEFMAQLVFSEPDPEEELERLNAG